MDLNNKAWQRVRGSGGGANDRDAKSDAVQPKPPPPPPPTSSSLMPPPPPPPPKKAAKKKDIRSLETVFFVHHWVTALASLSKHCFLLCICHLLIDRRALTSQVWLLTFLLRRHHRQCVHLQLRLRQAQAQAQARFARSESERVDF